MAVLVLWLAIWMSTAALAATPPPLATAQPGVAFQAATIASLDQPFALALGDLDGDGRLDIVTSHPAANALGVHLGSGAGRFAPPLRVDTGRFPRGVALADFDGDGHLDVAAAANFANAVAVHRGAGDGALGAPTLLPAGSHPFLLTASDLNGDGAADIAVALEGESAVALFLNDGSGGFGPRTLAPVGRSPSAVAVGDVNRDGTADLAVSCWRSNEIVILLGDGHGRFTRRGSVGARGWGLYDAFFGDLDDDGSTDLAYTDVQEQAIVVRYGDGWGAFPRAANVRAGTGLRAALAADLNGDARLDLAGANLADDTVSVALADAGGGFQAAQTVAVGPHPRMVVAGDVDDDGDLDLVTSSMQSAELTLLLNRGPTLVDLAAAPTAVQLAPAFDPRSFVAPGHLALDGRGHLYVADPVQHRIARIDLASGAVATAAGTGAPGFGGDGGPATAARLTRPAGMSFDAGGNLYVADLGNNRVRRVDRSGTITTVAGTGEAGLAGDGGPAAGARLNGPSALVVDRDGTLLVADGGNARIRRIDHRGVIATALVTGVAAAGATVGADLQAFLQPISGMALLADGDLLLSEPFAMRIRRFGSDGTATTFAGSGILATSGDGGPATQGALQFPGSLAVDAAGNVYVSDQGGNRVRRIAADGTLSTIAGTGLPGFAGDGGPAVQARLWAPFGIAAERDGTLYVSDRSNGTIRRIDPAGIITSVAGRPRSTPSADLVAAAPTPRQERPLGASPVTPAPE